MILLLFGGAGVAPPPSTDTRGRIALTDALVDRLTTTDAARYGLVITDALSP